MRLITEPYLAQAARWPLSGRHTLPHHDEESIVVYEHRGHASAGCYAALLTRWERVYAVEDAGVAVRLGLNA